METPLWLSVLGTVGGIFLGIAAIITALRTKHAVRKSAAVEVVESAGKLADTYERAFEGATARYEATYKDLEARYKQRITDMESHFVAKVGELEVTIRTLTRTLEEERRMARLTINQLKEDVRVKDAEIFRLRHTPKEVESGPQPEPLPNH